MMKYVSMSNTAVKKSLATKILAPEPAYRLEASEEGAVGTVAMAVVEIGSAAARTRSRIARRGSPRGCDHR